MSQSYEENIKHLIKISASEVENLSTDAYVYFGRGSCGFCREFSTQFKAATVLIYYIDTSLHDRDGALFKARKKYDVITVPTFMKRKADGTFIKLNRDVRESISQFLTRSK